MARIAGQGADAVDRSEQGIDLQCWAETKGAVRCRNPAAEGQDYCSLHLSIQREGRSVHRWMGLSSLTMSEEDLQEKVAVEWLDALGFSGPDIERQLSFSLKFGRGIFVTSRADVVVRRAGKPLFVLEAKRPSTPLTADDAMQALSYARLLTPNMAPLVVVTNGHTTHVYNTFTGEPFINPELQMEWLCDTASRVAPGTEDIDLQYQALRSFISLSYSRAVAFCTDQVRFEAASLCKPRVDAPYFDPDLYLPRSRLQRSFRMFLESDRLTYVISGAPGVGKSSAIYNLARDCASSDWSCLPLLFWYRSTGGNILERLALDFNLVFSQDRNATRLFQDLVYLCKAHSSRLVIFIDDLDGVSADSARVQLDLLVRILENGHGQIKLVLAAQPLTWRRLALDRDMPSRVAQSLDNSGTTTEEQIRPSAFLHPFSDYELESAFRLYQEHYQVEGQLGPDIRSLCKVPYALHQIAQIHRRKQLPGRLAAEDLVAAVVDLATQRSGADTVCRDALRATASRRVLAARASAAESGQDDVVALRRDVLSVPGVTSEGVDAAIRAGLLELVPSAHGRDGLRFTNAWLEAYCIVFLALELDRFAPDSPGLAQFLETIVGHQWHSNAVLRWALSWYADFAPAQVRAWLFAEAEEGARRYADAWMRVLQLVPAVSAHRPYVTTLLFSVAGSADPFYAERFSSEPTERLSWCRAEPSVPSRFAVDAAAQAAGGTTPRWTIPGLRTAPEQRAHDAAAAQVRRLIDRNAHELILGRVNLSREFTWALVRAFADVLDVPRQPALVAYPLELVDRAIAFADALEYFYEEFRRENGRREVWSHYETESVSYGRGDHERIRQRAADAVAAGLRPRPESRSSSPPVQLLADLVARHRAEGLDRLEPLVDISTLFGNTERSSGVHGQMDGVAAFRDAVEQLYRLALREYRELVHQAFPGVVQHLGVHARQSVAVELDIMPRSWPRYGGVEYFSAVYREPREAESTVDVVVRDHLTREVFSKLREPGADEEYRARWVSRDQALISRWFEHHEPPGVLGHLPADAGTLADLLDASRVPEVACLGTASCRVLRYAPVCSNVLRWLHADLRRYGDELDGLLRDAAFGDEGASTGGCEQSSLQSVQRR